MTVLTKLDEEESYLAALLEDPSGIDLIEFALQDHTPGREDTCYRVYDYQWPWWRSEETYQIDQCIAEGTLVLTEHGHIPIEQVEVGTKVLTHTGSWKPVTAVIDNGEREVVRLRPARNYTGLRLTPDHRVYAAGSHASGNEPQWLLAGKLRTGGGNHHRLATPAAIAQLDEPSRSMEDENLWWLAGSFFAAGEREDGRLVFVGRSPELTMRRLDALDFIYTVDHDERQRMRLKVNSQRLNDAFQRLLTPTGGVHPRVYSHRNREHFMRGVMGSAIRRGIGSVMATSELMMLDLFVLGSTLHRGARINAVTGMDKGSTVSHHLDFSGRKVLGMFQGHHQWTPAGSVTPDGISRVWDLEVEDDHSFVAGGYVVHNCSRSIGKSESILARATSFPFCFAGQEMLVTAPELNHLDPITSKIEDRFLRGPRLFRAMLPAQKGGGVKHQPQFQMTFVNGSRIVGRLPQRDGKGVKGQHPLRLEMDESQDYPTPGWMEIIETMKAGVPGSQWRAHGVSRGVRDMYYKMTMGDNPDIPFYVHRYPAMYRPTWTAEERKQKTAIYGGSRDNPDYKRNIYGEHGDVTNPVFVLARLMACVRINESTWATQYNENVYNLIKVEGEAVVPNRPIESFLDFPQTHLMSDYSSYWGGMDIGFTNDPSELLIFGQIQQQVGGQKVDVLRLLTRIHLMRISAPDQERVIEEVANFYGDRLRAISLDRTGAGLPIWQHMEGRPVSQKIKGYGFAEKRAVMLDEHELGEKDKYGEAVIEKNVIAYATDKLRSYVDARMVELPYDQELLTEFQGQTVQYSRDEGSRVVGAKYGGGSYHTLDAAKLMILGKEMESMEELQRRRGFQPEVLDVFLDDFGW